MTALIIFDLDGTLVDASRDLTLSVNLTREEFKLPPLSIDTVMSYLGNGARKLVERSFEGSFVDIDEALEIYTKTYAKNVLHDPQLYDGVVDGIAKLKEAGYKLAVITNKSTKMAEEILTHLKISENFESVVGDGSGFPLKPEPDALIHMVEETGCKSKRSWIVGDHYTDLKAGRKAGLKRCFCTYGFGHSREEDYDFKADTFTEFIDHILN